MITTSTREGDLKLDPMAGVGTTGHVARALGRRFIMIEDAPEYVDAMRRRFGAPMEPAMVGAPDDAQTSKYLKLAGPA